MNPIQPNGHPVVPAHVLSGNGSSSPIELERDCAVGPSDGNDRAFPRAAAKYRDEYWELGWTDGRLGQPFAGGEAAVEWRTIVDRNKKLAERRGEIAAATSKIASIKEKIGSLPKELADLRSYQHELRTTRFKDTFQASIPIGILYTLVGLVLFIADLPLSLKLVTEGLNIPREVDGVSVDQLFSKPLDVIFGPTWEAVFLAAGIAFSGMFVKYYLEEVLFPQKLGATSNNDASAQSEDSRRTRRVVFTIIFVLFLSTAFFLGIFRASAEQSAPDPSAIFSLSTLRSTTFTLLTLTFPIVGAVCFSAGSRRLADGCRRVKRIMHYYRVAISVFWIESKYQPLQTSLADAQADLSRLQELLKQEQDDATNSAATLLNLNLYKHGYLRGCTLPETLHVEERLYPQAKRVVEKFLARDLRTQVWKNFDPIKLNGD